MFDFSKVPVPSKRPSNSGLPSVICVNISGPGTLIACLRTRAILELTAQLTAPVSKPLRNFKI